MQISSRFTLAVHIFACIDVFKDDYKITSEFDVVVDAFGAWTERELPLHSSSLKVLCDALSGTDIRLLVVGGAGSLYVNTEHTACVADGPDFPDMPAFYNLIHHGNGIIRIADDTLALFIQRQLLPAKNIFAAALAFRLEIPGRAYISPLHV